MHWKDFDFNLLPVLDALLRLGSVSAAADHLGLAQPAVSKALRRLRIYFGDPLFVRTGHGMAATPRAMELAPAVAQVMETARTRLVPGAGFDAAVSTRVFTISMSDVAELVFLPTLLPRLQALAPQVKLRVVQVPPRDLGQAMEQRNVDLGLGSVRLLREGLFQQQLFHHPLACIASPRHPAVATGLTLADYRSAGHIGVTAMGADEDIFEWALQEQAVQRRFTLFTPSFMVLPMLLQHSDLLATVPQRLADTFVGYGAVHAWPMPVPLAPLALRQTWHARFHHDPANTWLRQLVCQLFQSQVETPDPATAAARWTA